MSPITSSCRNATMKPQ